jgi:eukaryotic-like serine/threonine-protein kinase
MRYMRIVRANGEEQLHAIGPKAGMTVGRYHLVRCIGQGASGTVFEAVHRSLGRRVAVKIWHAPPPNTADAEKATRRFFREGRAAARVHHPHVVDVYDVGVEDGVPFLVMELVEGESLAQRLRRETKMSLEGAIEILLPVLSAVAELHAAGIVHRDIKPANILLVRGELFAKLADFGVSRFDDGSPSITRSGAVIGTPAYMAPELLQGRAPASDRSDVYALGATLYECVTGETPFQGATEYALMHAVVSAAVTPPSARDRSLPEALDAVVLRAMQRDPEARYGSVDELAEALLPFAPPPVATRWRSAFSLPGTRLEWEADAAGLRSRRAGDNHRRPRIAGIVPLALVAGAFAGLFAGARMVAARRPASPPSTVRVAAATEAPTAFVPAAATAGATQAPPAAATEEPGQASGPSHDQAAAQTNASTTRIRSASDPDRVTLVRIQQPTPAASHPSMASRLAPPPSAGEAENVSASPPVRGENGAPILDVP